MTENAPIWLDPGHGKYVLCSVMSVSYRSPEFSSTFHDHVIISPSSFWQAQGDLMKRIWQTEISCAAHDDDTRLDCGDHMWPGERGARDQMMTLGLGPSDGQGEQRRERERGVSLERNLFPSSQACLVCPRPGHPTWPAPLAPASGHWWSSSHLAHINIKWYLVLLVYDQALVRMWSIRTLEGCPVNDLGKLLKEWEWYCLNLCSEARLCSWFWLGPVVLRAPVIPSVPDSQLRARQISFLVSSGDLLTTLASCRSNLREVSSPGAIL